MTKNQIENTLRGMVGRQFSYQLKKHRVLSFEAKSSVFKVVTDQEEFLINIEHASDFFRDFIHIESDLIEHIPVSKTVRIPQAFKANDAREIILPKTSLTVNSSKVTETIFEAIEKIKKDPGYIPQAQAINELLKTNIDLAKAEVELIKTVMR